jgi:hypothetical protein
MRQLELFTVAELAEMRDRTRSRRYSPANEQFRREHARRRSWGLARRHAEKLRRARERRHDATQESAPLQPATVLEQAIPPATDPVPNTRDTVTNRAQVVGRSGAARRRFLRKPPWCSVSAGIRRSTGSGNSRPPANGGRRSTTFRAKRVDRRPTAPPTHSLRFSHAPRRSHSGLRPAVEATGSVVTAAWWRSPCSRTWTHPPRSPPVPGRCRSCRG